MTPVAHWPSALALDCPRAVASRLCGTLGWASHQDDLGRNVWMATLAAGQGASWPFLASRPDAWVGFGLPDRRGRTVLDYLVAGGFPLGVRLGEWARVAASQLTAAAQAHPGLAQRLASAPLPWPPGVSWDPALIGAWREAVPWDTWGMVEGSDQEAAIVGQDVASGGRLWAWMGAAVLLHKDRWPPERRWVPACWAFLQAAPLPAPFVERALSEAAILPGDARALGDAVQRWCAVSPSPGVRALSLALSLPEGQGMGRRPRF